MSSGAYYPLSKIRDLIENCEFPVLDKSTGAVIAAKRLDGQELTYDEAETWIKKQLETLTEGDFAERKVLWDNVKYIADVYAKIIEGESWYIKLYVNEQDILEDVSFHPLERVQKVTSGETIKEGRQIYENNVWKLRK